MRRRERPLSLREQRLIDGFITDICRERRIPAGRGELYQCAWAAFLSVYRDDPGAFSGTGLQGWERAYQAIGDALAQAQRDNGTERYRQTSLNQPVNDEVQIPQIELLQARHGDFQNSVGFHDYLGRMERDTRRMAYCLINGETLEEVRAYYHWTCDHAARTYYNLRSKMEAYLNI